jgi:hypothetical protein
MMVGFFLRTTAPGEVAAGRRTKREGAAARAAIVEDICAAAAAAIFTRILVRGCVRMYVHLPRASASDVDGTHAVFVLLTMRAGSAARLI